MTQWADSRVWKPNRVGDIALLTITPSPTPSFVYLEVLVPEREVLPSRGISKSPMFKLGVLFARPASCVYDLCIHTGLRAQKGSHVV